MKTTILQVPVKVELRNKAATAASQMGFSSLQEAVRVFLQKMAKKEVNLKFEETVQLSPKAAARYDKMLDDIKSGKEKVFKANNVDDLMDQLHGRKNPVQSKLP